MANRYLFHSTLTGHVNVYKDIGKYNNRTFGYTIPADFLRVIERDRIELLAWARSKTTGRVQEAMTPWDETGLAKYTYGKGNGSRKAKREPIFVDVSGKPISPSLLKEVRQGTRVRLIVDQKPYAMGATIGTSLMVQGVEVIERVTKGDRPQDLKLEEIVALFKDSLKGTFH